MNRDDYQSSNKTNVGNVSKSKICIQCDVVTFFIIIFWGFVFDHSWSVIAVVSHSSSLPRFVGNSFSLIDSTICFVQNHQICFEHTCCHPIKNTSSGSNQKANVNIRLKRQYVTGQVMYPNWGGFSLRWPLASVNMIRKLSTQNGQNRPRWQARIHGECFVHNAPLP